MYRLARFDVTRRFVRPETRILAQIGFGIACAAMTLGVMLLVQFWTPLPGPFAFLFPAILIATLYGGWTAGLVALVAGTLAILYLILPNSVPLSFSASSDGSRATTAALVGLVLLVLAASFRASVARHAAERDREIERSDMLLHELEHRTRNNFALVASLLDFQRRQSSSPEAARALEQAISRVRTFADAYSHLATSQTETSDVEMHPYLTQLLDRVADALFGEQIKVERDIANLVLPSRTAVAIGLYVNEALTNCAKYAFAEGRDGTVRVALISEGDGWQLSVLDDGIGDAGPAKPKSKARGGLGAILFEALAAQAGAQHVVTLPEKGRRLDLVSVE
jgi:two-component sensor histidine kinase